MGIGSPSLYAAFGSKEALYVEAIAHYQKTYEDLVWQRFRTAPTAYGAIYALLMDSAAALTGAAADIPPGCLVTLSAVASEGHAALGKLVRDARGHLLDVVRLRLKQGVAAGELQETMDVDAAARFIQSVQNGMAIQARDGATRAELEGAAKLAVRALS